MDETKRKNDGTNPLESALSRFADGENTCAYDTLGCHLMVEGGIYTSVFRVWAPSAEAVFLVSDFCGWECGVPMARIGDTGVWELQYGSPDSLEYKFYKYKIVNGESVCYKADPYAVSSQTRSETASILRHFCDFPWEDAPWLAYRSASQADPRVVPVNIYEVHLGSWQTTPTRVPGRFGNALNYREIADRLAPYVKKMGYTHVELMPVMEHPYDGSFGYRICGYFAPTSRYGSPEDLMYFINRMHTAGIGVILDWNPATFPSDEHGLIAYDGTDTYEMSDPYGDAEARDYRTFDFEKGEVRSFLLSGAMFWLRRYHVDGLRVSAVSHVVHSAPEGGVSEAAAMFLRQLTTFVRAEFPDAWVIADGAHGCTGVTAPIDRGGFGFHLKWHSSFGDVAGNYMAADPIYRQHLHEKLIAPWAEALEEQGILTVAHDSVIQGRRSLIEKMYGGYEEKFSAMRAFLLYMMTFPGKKLTFMGCEFAQFREWDYQSALEWFMVTDHPRHRQMQDYVRALNHFYLREASLWELDGSADGFRWLASDERGQNVIGYERCDRQGDRLLVLINFSPVRQDSYRMYVPEPGQYEVLFRTDGDKKRAALLSAKRQRMDDELRYYLPLTLPPYSSLVLRRLPAWQTDGEG